MPLFKSEYTTKVPDTDLTSPSDKKEQSIEKHSNGKVVKSEEQENGEQKHRGGLGSKSSTTNHTPSLEDYTVKDDDELTSSDEEEGREASEASVKNWFNRSRHNRSNNQSSLKAEQESSEVLDPAVASAGSVLTEGTPSQSKSGTPFRRSFRSFFRRDHDSDADSSSYDTTREVEGEPVEQKAEEADESEDILHETGEITENEEGEKLPSTTGSTARFWRGWRHSHNESRIEEDAAEYKISVETEVLTQDQKREKNMIKLADQLSDSSVDKEKALNHRTNANLSNCEKFYCDDEDQDSSSSSLERGLTLKEKIDAVFSASPQEKDEISPITPPVDTSDNPYKYVFEQSTVLGNHMVYDHAWLDKNSVSFYNFDSALKLLTKDAKSLPSLFENSNVTVSEISKELVGFIKHSLEIQGVVEEDRRSLENELTNAQRTVESLKEELEDKKNSNSKLAKQVEKLSIESCSLGKDLEVEKKLNHELTRKVQDLKGQKKSIKTHQKDIINEQELQITNFEKEMELKDTFIASLTDEKESLKHEIGALRKELQDIVIKHEVLQEKQGFTALQLSTILEKEKTKKEVDNRESVKNLELTTSMKNRFENTIGLLKVGNMKIQENFHNERRKVLDLRRERKILQKQMELTDCHRAQSLQFMSHLMLYYRGIIPDQMLSDFDNHLKILTTPYFSSSTKLEDSALEAKLKDCQNQVFKFYNEFARQTFLDQIVTKHVSYMRSNNFLSGQLGGLRKQIHDYEQYVDRLLKDIQEQKKTLEKNAHKISQLRDRNAAYKVQVARIAQ